MVESNTSNLMDGRLTYRSILLLMAGLALSGCSTTTEQSLLADGAVPLSGAELHALVNDRTEPWPQGANYYYPGGKLFVRWNNAVYRGGWEVKDGSVCRYVPELLPEPCAKYFRDDKGIVRLYDGKRTRMQTADFVAGNQLKSFWRNQL